ncbi:DUF5686 and carboxypeptidase-like regulatory domain-containing protein [Flavobacterium difficile]|uniref:Carboxypeptidase-like regulatory domain-containing protein n=1 Tax=Flavobacterium difficile TaxID=2709659 RepID=A0ABX0I0H6_9FLAO|nr:DUF5686 and carboxypeptidase-like regulatory domain-containing protein [Flavobacterium difficile]NHM00696.1 carboxypeptidase-like regulatory domain-containing protein [Flavobacterium difficile]
MKNLFAFIFLISTLAFSQTKVSGIILDDVKQPVAYATVAFKNSSEGVIADENGKFYLESKKTYTTLSVSFVGYKDKEIELTGEHNYDLKIVLENSNEIAEVKVYGGKTSKKNNPAIDILRKIWERKKKNGLRQFEHYQYDKYEKIEFDINSIDSTFMKSKIFKNVEFIFQHVDTSAITGKNFLPIFINETRSKVYGDNTKNRTKDVLQANKYSGFGNANNDGVNAFLKDLYADYDIYNNYLKFFDKDFISPLSRTGIQVYNYVLSDSTFIDNKWCYNIVYYPRRKNELTFKGDFWVNDSTFAIKSINMEASKSANINWVRDIYIEQEFDVLNDSVFLLKRDYMMTDFALTKKEGANGMYGKRTTMFKNHEFNQPKDDKFYREDVNTFDKEVYTKTDDYWEENRFESLNSNEKGIYEMLDTLKTVPKIKRFYNLVSILGSGYIQVGKFDIGPVFSTLGYNDVEGQRIRFGGRTYFGANDPWRIQGYTAYGFKDDKVKYGINARVMLNKKNRFIVSLGNRRDVEQIGVSLTTSNDVLGRSFASSSFFSNGINNKLTNVNLTNLGFEIEPVKNLVLESSFSYRTLSSASPEFKLDYFTDNTFTTTSNKITQSEINFLINYTPKRKMVGYGVDRIDVDLNYPRFFVSYSQGLKGVFDSDFNYSKLQLYYRQPLLIGGFGRLFSTIEIGKTFGAVPLSLMGIIPGNQSYFIIDNTYNLLNYYDFVADQYTSLHLEHNFNGKLFARVPLLRKLNWREIIGVKAVYGSVSDENIALNASGQKYQAPVDGYYEYSAGIGNIFKVMRIDGAWRGSYFNIPDARKFTIRVGFGFYF